MDITLKLLSMFVAWHDLGPTSTVTEAKHLAPGGGRVRGHTYCTPQTFVNPNFHYLRIQIEIIVVRSPEYVST
jgi:hypothetical protein